MIDLTGRTVTQAIAVIQEVLGGTAEEEMTFMVDNEVVKLNLYNYLHREGQRFKLEKQGNRYLFHIKNRKGRKEKPLSPGGKTAFPIAHLSGDETPATPAPPAPPAPTRKRRRSLIDKAAATPQTPPVAAPTPAPVARPSATPAAEARERGAPWVVVQTDQIGQKDVSLGIELLEDLLSNLDETNCSGLFLIHRGVRLLDATFAQGRFRELLLRKRIPVMACTKSVMFYQLTEKVPEKIDIQPARVLFTLGGNTHWI